MSRRTNHEKLVLKALGGGLWDYDIDSDVMMCNDRWYAIVGIDPVLDPVRAIADFQRHIHPDDVAYATLIDRSAIAGMLANDHPYRMEFRIIRPDGAFSLVQSVASIIRDRDGHIHAIGCITEIAKGGTDKVIETTNGASAPAVGTRAVVQSALSDRERECLDWLSRGKTAWETAAILGLSPRTIEFHLNKTVDKLGAANKVHAMVIAIRSDLI